MKYGYLPPSDPSTGQLQAWTAVTNAVRAMQRFAGLKDTGIVGEDYRGEGSYVPQKYTLMDLQSVQPANKETL